MMQGPHSSSSASFEDPSEALRDSRVRSSTRCRLYDLPPDRDIVLDRVPEHPGVTVAIGAGHAAKVAGLALPADRPAPTDAAFEAEYRLGGSPTPC